MESCLLASFPEEGRGSRSKKLWKKEVVVFVVEEENFFFLQNSVLFPSLFSPFNSFVLPHLSIKMAADKDKMEVDGSPPPATAQAGPAATQVRWKNTKKKKKKKKREMQSVNDDADGRWPRRFNAQCCLPVLSPSQARLKSPALDLREQRGALTC